MKEQQLKFVSTKNKIANMDSRKAHLLYVEDDESLSFVTKDNLEINGYEVTHTLNGQEALQIIERKAFDLYILDVMLPDVDGFSIATAIRKKDMETPILFLTAKSLKEDRIHGLKLGADDYITKPFSIEELLLKIEIFLKRNKITIPVTQKTVAFGRYQLNHPNLELSNNGTTRRLTQREADLLKYFIDRKNQVLKRSDILESIWGENDYFLGRSLDVFISRLRKYLKDDPQLKIENVHGVGFQFRVRE